MTADFKLDIHGTTMRLLLPAAAGLALAALAGCAHDARSPADDTRARAERIAAQHIIVDTHIDLPYRLMNSPADVTAALDSGDFDYPRARAGGLDAAFMSIYTSASLEAEGGSFERAEALIDIVEGIVADAPDKFAIALSPADVRAHFAAGVLSLPMGMENGSPIEGELSNVQYFYDRGIRYITLAHSLSNHLADSSYDDNRVWRGLSEFGAAVVDEMNRLGIMIDVSHLSDEAFWDVLEQTSAPVIASHSSARHFTPGFERNMSDAMIEALAANGGVIMINFGSAFLTDRARAYGEARRDALAAWNDEHADAADDSARERFLADYEAVHGPYPFATLEDVLDHIDHVVALVGVDHVGLGSDFDGVGDTLPLGLKDAAAYPNLVEGLLRRGYAEEDIVRMLGENLLRVWAEVEQAAS